MSHQTTHMSVMESGTQRLGEGVGRINNAGDVTEDNVALGFPFLNCEVLDVDVTSPGCWATGVNHEDRSLIIFVEDGWSGLCIVKLMKNRAEVFCYLGGLDSSDEFGLGRAGGNGRLDLGLVRDGSAAEHERQSGDRSACSHIGGMSRVHVSSKGCRIQRLWKHWKRRIRVQRGERAARKRFDRGTAPV